MQKPLTALKDKGGDDLSLTQVYKKLLDGTWAIQKQLKLTEKQILKKPL